ncbi:sushi, von Willebrand factor type A, EGF and pentraxin domain-containing 1-like [Paramuricea clavata]|uniref:Sushi, von Willebrand factor type A, EGF and pentraxin domain-containing 1-like n=1 Tax=Paramuricea clavata TaxID=317549 RepID=A0A7D9LAZ8_PARCT|nr:sushi, von Willebrand factor type A, EGF and pentraxin domain-containing 1-like [Paramuricea clavata]
MTNGARIADEQITASSELDDKSLAKYGRYGCWCPSWEDEQPWLQVNFSRMVTISKIKTQGRPDADEWVKSYELHYSSDNAATFEAHKDVLGDVQTYIGNKNRDTHATNGVTPVIYTQFIRIRPKTWNDHVGLRVEFRGCNGVNYCLNNPCLNSGACVMYTNGFGCSCPSDYTGNACQTYITPPPTLPPTTSSGTTLPPTTSSGTTLPPTTSSGTTLPPTTPSGTTLPPTTPSGTTLSPPSALQTTQSNIGGTTQTNLDTGPTNPLTTTSSGITGSTSVPTGSVSTTMGYASIAGFALNPIPAQEFGQSFSVGWVMTAGTNVTVAIAYNGIPCCNAIALSNTGGQCDCLISVPGLFDPDGVVNISAVASNLVSSVPAYIQIEVLKTITQVSFTMLTTYSDFGTGVEGRGSQKNIFPAEYPVIRSA